MNNQTSKTITQHRSTHDKVRGKELSDLKRENKQLARANKRLQKQLSKALAVKEVWEDMEAPTAQASVPDRKVPTCPKCSGVLQTLTLAVIDREKTIEICPECKYRKAL